MASETPEPGRASTPLPLPYTHAPHANQAKRIWFKLATKYGGDVSKVTDCARISLEFATAEGLERAAKFVLQSASTFKNRVANPTDEGYRDLMFTVLIEGHVCEVSARHAAPRRPFCCPAACSAPHRTLCMGCGELWPGGGGEGWGVGVCGPRGRRWWAGGVAGRPPSPRSHAVPRAPPPQVQLHLVEMIKAKKSGAGHRMYKVCRRVLTGPIVEEDTYCLEVVGKELRGEGERNAQGEREGRGTMVYASGDMYEGQWRAGEKHGQGKSSCATGDVYEGGWVEDERHGHGKYTFADGEAYEGEFVQNVKHGRGKTRKADGESYDGEYADNQRHGVGTYTYADGRVEVGRYEAGDEVGQGVQLECGPDGGVGAAGRRGGAQHPAGRGGPDRRADRAAAALNFCRPASIGRTFR